MALTRPPTRTREPATHVETSTEQCNRIYTLYIIDYIGFSTIRQFNQFVLYNILGYAVVQLVEAMTYKPEGRGSMVSLEFFIDMMLPAAL